MKQSQGTSERIMLEAIDIQKLIKKRMFKNQEIGLLDKTGISIREGDIVRFIRNNFPPENEDRIGVIVFANINNCVAAFKIGIKAPCGTLLGLAEFQNYNVIKVIGHTPD